MMEEMMTVLTEHDGKLNLMPHSSRRQTRLRKHCGVSGGASGKLREKTFAILRQCGVIA